MALLVHNQKFHRKREIRVQVPAAVAVAQVAESPFLMRSGPPIMGGPLVFPLNASSVRQRSRCW